MQTFNIILIIIGAIVLGLIVFLEINRRKTQKEERSWMDIKHEENDPLENDDRIDEVVIDEVYDTEDAEPIYYSEDEDVSIIDDELIDEDPMVENSPEDLIEDEDEDTQHEFIFSKTKTIEPKFSDDDELSDEDELEVEKPIKPELIVENPDTSIKTETFQSEHEEVFVLSVMTQEDDFFEGADLMREFNAQNLQFGAMGFYHRTLPGIKNINLFSVANIMKPGSFDQENMMNLKTRGLLLFMNLPGKLEPIQAFDQFYDTTDALAVNLGGKICDEHRNILSQHRLGQIRDKIRHLGLKLELERKKANKNS